ncbi:hypothetical protein PSDI105340_07745 [Pseudoalteromonas distincta]
MKHDKDVAQKSRFYDSGNNSDLRRGFNGNKGTC